MGGCGGGEVGGWRRDFGKGEKGRTVEPGHGSGRQRCVKRCLGVVYLCGKYVDCEKCEWREEERQ